MRSMETQVLGAIRIDRIVEFEKPFFSPISFFDEATPEALAPHRYWLEPWALDPATGNLVMPVQSYLVRTRHHIILIDTCVGCRKSSDRVDEWFGLTDESWLTKLAVAGVQPDAVDYVFCTHFHLDHCGWNTRLTDGRWTPTFPNARYIFAREEYAAAEATADSVYHENLLPIMEAGQGVLVDMHYALDDEVWLEPTPGHTPGHVAVNLSSNGRRAVMCGDIMHTPLQVAEPEWSPNFDHDIVLSRETRKHFLESHCDTDTLVLTAHFPSPSAGRVVPHAGRGFDFNYL
jgi:glyoxylase-like metal-dependent hydrolase (beta-lactamase superfamily II)